MEQSCWGPLIAIVFCIIIPMILMANAVIEMRDHGIY